MSPKAFMTMALMTMAIALFNSAEGARIRSVGVTSEGIQSVGTTSEGIKALYRAMVGHTNFQGQVKHAVEQVDTLLADSNVHDQLVAFDKELEDNPQLQQTLVAMLEDPRLQEQMALVEKQMEAMKLEKPSAPSFLEVSESSGGQATIAPWKVMAAVLLLTDPSLAFRLGTMSGLSQSGSALGKTNLARPFPTMQVEPETDEAELDKVMSKSKDKGVKLKAEAEAAPEADEEEGEAAPEADEETGAPMGPAPEGFEWGETY